MREVVEELIQAELSITRACQITGLSRAAYYKSRQSLMILAGVSHTQATDMTVSGFRNHHIEILGNINCNYSVVGNSSNFLGESSIASDLYSSRRNTPLSHENGILLLRIMEL